MKIRIGYLGMPHTLLENIHTMTYQKYKKLNNLGTLELDKIISTNLETLNKVIDYNYQNNIFFYRMTHNLFPLHSIKNIDYDYLKHKAKCLKIGEKIKQYNMRIDAHPDHFLILSTTKQEVLENSIRIIENHKTLFDMLNINAKIILHIGSREITKEDAIKRFENNFLKLDKELQNIILLENDDRIYTVTETLELCERLNIPMVLDYHHFKCNHLKNEKIDKLLPRIIKTWQDTNLPPKMHFSSPKNLKEKRTHNFYIDYNSFIKFVDLIKNLNINIDIMLESKGKDEALFKLLRQLKYYKKFKMKKNEIIIN